MFTKHSANSERNGKIAKYLNIFKTFHNITKRLILDMLEIQYKRIAAIKRTNLRHRKTIVFNLKRFDAEKRSENDCCNPQLSSLLHQKQ